MPSKTNYRAFWADEVADEIEARNPTEPIVIKGGVSPSGVPHLGHINEILRGYFVAEILRERDYEVNQVFTSDDKDPLRGIPRRLATLDFDLIDLGDISDPGILGRNLGRPLTDVPDPFDECDCGSFGAHQTKLLQQSAELLDVPIEIISNTELYAEGAFEDVTRTLLNHHRHAQNVLSNYQSKVDDEYVPFNSVCQNCGKLTETVTGMNLSTGTVKYVCTDIEAGNRTIEGCGYRGTVTLREGKLPWRFEWPAQWDVLNVDFEPFGKDHAEGSWPSGEAIATQVLGIEPPVPMVYEWFTLDGEPLSSSSGNILTIDELLEMVELSVVKFFFSKDPTKSRDFNIDRLDLLVNEFDQFEQLYFNELDTSNSNQKAERAKRAYPFLIGSVSDEEKNSYSFGTERKKRQEYKEIQLDISVGTTLQFEAVAKYGSTFLKTTQHTGGSFGHADLPLDHRSEMISLLNDLDFIPTASSILVTDIGEELSYKWDMDQARAIRRSLIDEIFSDRSRIPYTFAAVLGMTPNLASRTKWALSQNHLSQNTPRWAAEEALARVDRARTWARRTDNEYNYRLATDLPDTDFDADTEAALSALADFCADLDAEGEAAGEEIQGAIYETARAHDLAVGDFFAAGYRLFLDEKQGPQLGPFLAELDREFVVARLRREA